MKQLLIATNNPGKLKEISSFLKHLPFEILSLGDVKIIDDIEEDGKTYAENSLKKARFFMEKSGLPVISDDGGLEIEALDNAPGVHSRRWIGKDATEKDLIEHMRKVAKKLPGNNRTAWFRTVITFISPSGKILQQKGEVKGVIAKKPFLKLLKGYPYRSFFFIPEINKYYHENELTEGEMRLYNHRYKAIQKIIPQIIKELGLR